MRRSYFGIIAVVFLIAARLFLPVKSEAISVSEFPSPMQLKQSNVALNMEGFDFASGLKKNRKGKHNGKGFEVVPARWVGSGFIAATDGRVITNYHVASKAIRAVAMFDDKSRYDIRHISAYDSAEDLAILKISSDRQFSAVQLGDSDQVEPMDRVLAVGNPQGLGINISEGGVSQVKRDDDGRVQLVRHTSPLASGSSGGSLYKGQHVIGVNATILKGTQFNQAIPINKAKRMLRKSQNNMVPLAEAFPTNPVMIEKRKFKFIHGGTAKVSGAKSSQIPGFFTLKFQFDAREDYMIWVDSPGNDLAVVVMNSKGDYVGIGNEPKMGYEGVLISSKRRQNVTIGVLNDKPQTVKFGMKIGSIVW